MRHLLTAVLLAALSILSSPLLAQETDPNNGLKHWMTPEEASRSSEIGMTFTETDPPPGIIRNVEEFGPTAGVLVRYPFGIPLSVIKEMAEDATVTTLVANTSQQSTVTAQYQSAGVNLAHCNFLIASSDSYWTRDYGPWYVNYADSLFGIIDFPYNRPRPNDDEVPKKVATMQGIEWFGMNVIHTGGNYMTDGLHQSSSTTLVWDENPTQTHAQVAQKLHDYCGIDDYKVVQDPNNTYIDHIDCWGKFLGPDKVLIRKVPASHAQYDEIEAVAAYFASQISSYGTPYRVYRVNTPNNEPYTNSYILNNKVLVPFMGTANDIPAKAAYQQAMPGYEIIGFLGLQNAPWESTDALHCRTHELADMGMLYIEHTPVTGTVPFREKYTIGAEITAFSRQQVYPDSAWVIYKVNGGSYDTLQMIHTGGKHWQADIPAQLEGSTVAYYIHAEDASGRSANHPFIGAPDPHVFQVAVSGVADIMVYPDTLLFLTFQDMQNGLPAYAVNYTTQPALISYINHPEAHPFPWYIDPWNIALPHTVLPGDTVELLVKIFPGVKYADLLCDTLHVDTPDSTNQVMICVDPALISELNDPVSRENLISVSPNPFDREVNFSFLRRQTTPVELFIYNASGGLVYSLSLPGGHTGTQSLAWEPGTGSSALAGGIYYYRLLVDGSWYSGKLLLNR